MKLSKTRPVVVMKHSNSCTYSNAAKKRMESFEGTVYEVDVKDSRDLSNMISAQTKIRHESPQVVVIHNSNSIGNLSHADVTSEKTNQLISHNSV